ncbi:MAG TPA: antibiotic biosynthesis monooxygenase [Gaiellaceae bacterium]
MIVRILRAWTDAPDARAYAEYLDEALVPDLASAEGNAGVIVLWRVVDERAEFLVLSLWRSKAAADAFAAAGGVEALGGADDEFVKRLALEPDDYQFYVRGDLALGASLWLDD